MKALIIFHTNTGHTKRAADDIAEGLRGQGVDVTFQDAKESAEWDTDDKSIVIVGSPCHAGSLAIRAGISSPIRSILKKLQPDTLTGKIAGAFSVNSGYGGRRTVQAIEEYLRNAGAQTPQQGVVVRAGVPFSLFTGPMAPEEAREQLRQLGREIANSAGGDGEDQ